jgi:LuxR family maltose regulon positive regulatory protein
VAWVTVSLADNAPEHFLASVAGALATPRDPCPVRTADDIAAVIVDALLAAPAGIALVLDDYHRIASAAVRDAVAIVLDYLPPHVLIAIAGRMPPPLPIARLRARRQLVELEVGSR